jgi:mevalonate kinase
MYDAAILNPLEMIKPESFNSKILLFGEYGMIYNTMALSVPFTKFSGRLDFSSNQSDSQSTAEILKFHKYLKSNQVNQKLSFPFDLEKLESDLVNGLYFNSSIPQQYGVGSSGALVAALFSGYAVSKSENIFDWELLKADFALLESYFHGKSSGIDPLISFLNQPLLIDSGKNIQTLDFDLNKSGLAIALIDTKTTGATGPLVQHFIDQMNFPQFQKVFETQFLQANNRSIELLLSSRITEFFESLDQLINFQQNHFQRMIPESFHSIIKEAITDQVFIKLLGSGGGGYLIAFAESSMVLEKWAKKYGIELLRVT